MFNECFNTEIDFLLEYGCPSIKYLVQRDFLNFDRNSADMRSLQADILNQPNIKKLLSFQADDGWLGTELHGNTGTDSLLTALLNSGVEPDNQSIQRAAATLLDPQVATQHKCYFHGGDALDLDGRGGNRAVVAKILAQVGFPEDTQILNEEISLAWKHLSVSTAYNSVDDFTIKSKNKRYYKPHALFPGANHIELLSLTNSWQTAENLETAKTSVTHCYNLMRDFSEYITFKKPSVYGGGFVGPFNYDWQSLTPLTTAEILAIVNNEYSYRFAFWIRNITNTSKWAIQSTGSYESCKDTNTDN